MEKEKWDILDKSGKPTGQTVFRGFKGTFPKGKYHLVVHIWIKNSKGEYLIQKRSALKKPMAGEWAATGGAVIAGESSEQGARRELFEELGIKAMEDDFVLVRRLKRKISFVDIWLCHCDTPAEQLVLQKEEVEAVKWVDRQTLCRMIKEGEFHNYGKEYFDVVFSA